MIHTYGDSHAVYTFRGVPWTVPHALGPITMRRIASGRTRKDRELIYALSEADTEHVDDTLLQDAVRDTALGPTDVVIVSCGEGDVRCFLKPQLDHDRTTAEVYVPVMVANYVNRVAALDTRGARTGVLSVPPPAPYERSWGIQWPPSQLNVPPAGGDAERAYYTRLINHYLARGCVARGLLFVDVHAKYANDEGMLICELSDGGVHIGDTTLVCEVLKELGVL